MGSGSLPYTRGDISGMVCADAEAAQAIKAQAASTERSRGCFIDVREEARADGESDPAKGVWGI